MTTLQAMQKKVRLGDKILTVTPAISKEKATRQLNLPGKEIIMVNSLLVVWLFPI